MQCRRTGAHHLCTAPPACAGTDAATAGLGATTAVATAKAERTPRQAVVRLRCSSAKAIITTKVTALFELAFVFGVG